MKSRCFTVIVHVFPNFGSLDLLKASKEEFSQHKQTHNYLFTILKLFETTINAYKQWDDTVWTNQPSLPSLLSL